MLTRQQSWWPSSLQSGARGGKLSFPPCGGGRRGAGAVERDGLENRCPLSRGPWVRIPPSPPRELGEIGRMRPSRRGVRVAEGARLESVCTGNRTAGSNPALSASFCVWSWAGREPLAEGAGENRGPARGFDRAGGRGGGREAGFRAFGRGRRVPSGESVASRCARNPALSASFCVRACGLPGFAGEAAGDNVAAAEGCDPAGDGDGGCRQPSLYHDLLRATAQGSGKGGTRVPRDGASRTSSGPEGSSDKGNPPGAAVPPGSSVPAAWSVTSPGWSAL